MSDTGSQLPATSHRARQLFDSPTVFLTRGCYSGKIADRDGNVNPSELTSLVENARDTLTDMGLKAGDVLAVVVASDRRLVAYLLASIELKCSFLPISGEQSRETRDYLTSYARANLVIDLTASATSVVLYCPLRAPVDQGFHSIGEAVEVDTVDDPRLLLLHTSGSKGHPKIVVCARSSIQFSVAAIQFALGYRSTDVVGCCVSMSFDYGLYQIFLSIIANASLQLIQPRELFRLAQVVSRSSITVLPVVPSLVPIIDAIFSRSASDQSTVRLITTTGESVSNQALETLRRRFPVATLRVMYGATECKRISIMPPDGDRLHPGSAGLPLDGVEVWCTNRHGERVPDAAWGEIVVRGGNVMSGYLGRSEGLVEAFNGTYRTGDYGCIDGDRYVYVGGRLDDQIKIRGIRANVGEIEARVLVITGIDQATLCSWDGEPIVGYVSAAVDEAYVVRELRRDFDSRIVPRVVRVPSVPVTVNGKVDRAALFAEIKERDRDGQPT